MTEHAPLPQRPPQTSRIAGRYTVIPPLEKLVRDAGGHNAAARVLHIGQGTLTRWRRSHEPHPPRLQMLLRMLESGGSLEFPDGHFHDVLRERAGITTSEYATLLGTTADALRGQSPQIGDHSIRHARRQARKLRPAMFVEGTELTAVRTASNISFADASLALGIAKTSLFKMEKALVSQHLIVLASTRLPLLRRLFDERCEHTRLCNVVGALGLGVHQAQRMLGLSRNAWRDLTDAQCHEAVRRILEAYRCEPITYSDAVTIVDGDLFRKHRISRMRSIADAATLHAVAPTRLQLIERTHGHLALFKRLVP